MRSKYFRNFIFVGAAACAMAFAASAQACSTSLTVNLTVELAPDLAKLGEDVLIELRQGVVGHSKVMNSQKFHGRTGTVFFASLCAGAYFMDIGNGPLVAVTPSHQFEDGRRYQATIRVTFAKGNVDRKSRSEL
jgi:hypothetical protein